MAGKKKRSKKRIALWVIGILVVIFALMQAVPYGRNHTNPPVSNGFVWADSQAEALAKTACYDCHSNQTDWWWATDIAPFSWLIQSDVEGARRRLNFSAYEGRPDVEEFQRAVQGGMPPFQYWLVHWNAKLNDTQKQTLIKGYEASLAANSGSSSGGSQNPAGQEGSTTTVSSSATTVSSSTTTAGSSAPSISSSTTSANAAAIAIINQACASCHSAAEALAFHASTASRAQGLIADMIRRGAKLTAEQQQVLGQYFTR